MGAKFLSDVWFEQVDAAKASIAGFTVPTALQAVDINIRVSGDRDEVLCCMRGGVLEKGHVTDASVTLHVTQDLAYRLFIENDQNAGMQGFMSGALRVEGDMSVLMALQSVDPTDSLRAYQAKVKEMTEY